MALAVSIEQAACKALAAWLSLRMTGVTLSDRWPDPDAALDPAGAVSIIRAGEAREITIQPEVIAHEIIHADISPVLPLRTSSIVDVPSSIVALNAGRASYETHRGSTAAHAVADTANAVMSPAATDQDSAEALANELLVVLLAHLVASAHVTADAQTTLAGAAPVATGDTAALVALSKLLLRALNLHYTARLYTWRVADLEQPVQLDVWGTYEASRDDVMARLVPLLHAGTSGSADVGDDDPVREGTLVSLGDGWSGFADFIFEQPSLIQTETAQKKREFRATYRGKACLWRLMKAQSPRIADLLLVGTPTTPAGAPSFTADVSRAPGGDAAITITT